MTIEESKRKIKWHEHVKDFVKKEQLESLISILPKQEQQDEKYWCAPSSLAVYSWTRYVAGKCRADGKQLCEMIAGGQ